MLGRTHLAIGLATTAAVITNPHVLPEALITAGISSLIPDIDEEHSLIRRKIDIIPGLPLGFPLLLIADYFYGIINTYHCLQRSCLQFIQALHILQNIEASLIHQ